jgi:hypothetical protein
VTTRLSIGDRVFYLADAALVERVKLDLIEALRRGGDLVDIAEAGHAAVSALITPGVPVFFEEQGGREEGGAAGNAVIVQFDSYDYFDWTAYGEIEQ